MISTEIKSVANTNILVAPNYNNTRQLTIYSNNVNNVSKSNAMVLPVPLPQTLQFIDLSTYSDIFKECAKCFYNPHIAKSATLSFTNAKSVSLSDDKPLEVFNVGSYKVSVAMNLEQVERADKKVFILSDGLKQTLNTFYYQPYWGFIICKLNAGQESYHPFAYSHQIIDNKIYIPTRHYHKEVKWTNINQWALWSYLDPKNNPLNMKNWTDDNIDQSPMFRTEQFEQFEKPVIQSYLNDIENNLEQNNIEKISSIYDNSKNELKSKQKSSTYKSLANDWSHSIYLLNINPNLNPQLQQMNSCKELWYNKRLFDTNKIIFDFGYLNKCEFKKIKIEGTHPNIDLVIPVSA